MASLSRFVILRTGARMPTLGLGTYQAMGSTGECQEAVECALDCGYRHIDTAHSYGNEAAIGEVLYGYAKAEKIKRTDLFVTTKVPSVYLAPKDVKMCVEESLANLHTQYLDMLLIHHPWGFRNHGNRDMKPKNTDGDYDFQNYDLRETWRTFEKVVKQGKAKAIGLSNFSVRLIEHISQGAQIQPANVQLELHAYLQQRDLRNYCADKGIVVTGYSPMGAPGRPEHQVTPGDPVLLNDPTVLNIAEKYQRAPAQILLNFALRLANVVLPKSVNKKRIKENADIFDIPLSREDMDKLEKLERNQRYFKFKWAKNHPQYTASEAF